MSGENSPTEAGSRSGGALGLRFFEGLTGLPLHWRIVASVLVTVAACLVRLAVSQQLGDRLFYFSFYPAIAVTAVLLGSIPAFAVVVLAILANHWRLGAASLPPLNDQTNQLLLGVFILNSMVVIFMARLLFDLARARRAGEDLIRINAEQLGQFVEQAPAAMAMFDRDMHYVAASAQWRLVHRLPRDLIGKSHYDSTPGIKDEWRQAHQRALAGETVENEQDLFVRSDGVELWLRWEVRPWRLAQDGIGGVVIFAEDITERIRIQEALRANERRLNAIVDAAMEAIVSFDASGAIQSANPTALEMFGYEREELLGRNVQMLRSELHLAEQDRPFAPDHGEGGKRVAGLRRRIEGQRKDGSAFPLELTICEAPIDQNMLFVGFLRDLSPIEEEKRRVNALRDELVHIARLNDMGEVVASLAHEVGQPIAAILNFSAAHRRAMAATGKSPEPDLIAKIEAQARRAAEILKRLRGFIEKRPPEQKAERIHDLVDDAIRLALLRSRAEVVHVPPAKGDGDFLVFADATQIGQVLINLLRNADDAVFDEAEPEILIEISADGPDKVRVSVADNGAGVDQEALEQLFAPFYSTKKFGMGVGLSISKSIVESHNGAISYRPNAPRGSIFEFTLPIDRPDGKPPAGA
ncbi:PAS domain S-box protein [uncultured Rhodoblastus sp.]|uniref:PAS domain S-box protein n=1 Tax=uncultured Rhodoblastus sp. TaxID=543037 RepID=UPI0025F55E98|nr:PAS domain S-box protein [uncultured Rhodoblastus sp.]